MHLNMHLTPSSFLSSKPSTHWYAWKLRLTAAGEPSPFTQALKTEFKQKCNCWHGTNHKGTDITWELKVIHIIYLANIFNEGFSVHLRCCNPNGSSFKSCGTRSRCSTCAGCICHFSVTGTKVSTWPTHEMIHPAYEADSWFLYNSFSNNPTSPKGHKKLFLALQHCTEGWIWWMTIYFKFYSWLFHVVSMFPLIFTGRMLLDTNCSCPTWTCVRRRVQALPSLWQANLGSCRGYTSYAVRRKFGVQCVAGVRHWADSYWLCFCATLQIMGGSCGGSKGILMADSIRYKYYHIIRIRDHSVVFAARKAALWCRTWYRLKWTTLHHGIFAGTVTSLQETRNYPLEQNTRQKFYTLVIEMLEDYREHQGATFEGTAAMPSMLSRVLDRCLRA